jgi:hypothetical protein
MYRLVTKYAKTVSLYQITNLRPNRRYFDKFLGKLYIGLLDNLVTHRQIYRNKKYMVLICLIKKFNIMDMRSFEKF